MRSAVRQGVARFFLAALRSPPRDCPAPHVTALRSVSAAHHGLMMGRFTTGSVETTGRLSPRVHRGGYGL